MSVNNQVNGTCWKKPIAFDCTMRKSSRLSRIIPNTEDSGTVLSSFAWNSGLVDARRGRF